ncbi:hypothetical protein W97_02127 [Coniosporium apollinis CBS 100218]|uniref:Uncharacterized protein n=1 Tax=Coniosporium apollinis (strain CBS 100218) TaxID=1168221 RepID=R7YLV6_CONA1|nr:uncharacterized protein W97_02127 [Coniosporium apollinis CBS 100218]EON62902.1 hypothetical protein W97_02127 [Coniosporium apollinis CBS 100218]
MFAFTYKLDPALLLFISLLIVVAAYHISFSHAAAMPKPPAEDFSPVPNADSSISKRDDLGVRSPESPVLVPSRAPTNNPFQVYLCNSANWTGVCRHMLLDTPQNVCHNLSAIEAEGGVSSFGPDEGVSCLVYDDYGCDSEDDGDMWGFSYPGEGDLASRGWDNRILSYKCFRTYDPEG